jgi:hypothetical protein
MVELEEVVKTKPRSEEEIAKDVRVLRLEVERLKQLIFGLVETISDWGGEQVFEEEGCSCDA